MKPHSLLKRLTPAILVMLMIPGALLGQSGWTDDGSVVIGIAKTAIDPPEVIR